jgi:ribosomal protein S8E
MAAGDIVQKGTSVVVGFNGLTYGTCIMIQSSEEPVADMNEIRGSKNEVVAKIYSNPGRRYTVEGVLLSADLTAARALIKGSTVSINSVSCCVEDVKISVGTLEAKVTITAIKEDSMTYT